MSNIFKDLIKDLKLDEDYSKLDIYEDYNGKAVDINFDYMYISIIDNTYLLGLDPFVRVILVGENPENPLYITDFDGGGFTFDKKKVIVEIKNFLIKNKKYFLSTNKKYKELYNITNKIKI